LRWPTRQRHGAIDPISVTTHILDGGCPLRALDDSAVKQVLEDILSPPAQANDGGIDHARLPITRLLDFS
jgi:hypothetical protein